MFFKKKPKLEVEVKLQDVVKKVANTGYVFVNINNDLGTAANDIQASTPMVSMTYAYARRAAMAALYVQGIQNNEDYDHVMSMFKGIQQIVAREDPSGHSVEFQERAFALSIEFMQSYSFLITAQFVKKVAAIINDYDLSEDLISDAELFAAVTESIYQEQKASLGEEEEDEEEEEEEEEAMSYIRDSIEKNGWQGAVTIAAMTVMSRIPSEDIAYQFILEELDGASQGDDYSREHARNSGITPQEYSGALSRSNPEVDGPDGPQQMLMAMSFQLSADRDKMAKFRCDVGRAVMEHFKLGAYAGDDEDID